jgi:hypothetical protein
MEAGPQVEKEKAGMLAEQLGRPGVGFHEKAHQWSQGEKAGTEQYAGHRGDTLFKGASQRYDMPEPGTHKAREWDGAGHSLEDHVWWFERNAPADVMGSERIHLFARYATPMVSERLREIPQIFGIEDWNDFLDYMRENYLDRSKTATITAQEFEAGVMLLGGETIKSYEKLVEFSEEFGALAVQYQRGRGGPGLADELYLRYLPNDLITYVLEAGEAGWRAKYRWNRYELPQWRWVWAALREVLHPKNKLGALRLQRAHPDWESHAELAKQAKRERAEAATVTSRTQGPKREGWAKPEMSDFEKAERMSIEELTRKMSSLTMAATSGSAKDRAKASGEYKVYHARLGKVAPGQSSYWPPNVGDTLRDGESLAKETQAAWAMAQSKGVGSVEYLVAHTNVQTKAGSGVSLGLPVPTYYQSNSNSVRVYPGLGRANYGGPAGVSVAAIAGGGRPQFNRPSYRPLEQNAATNCYFCGKIGHPQWQCPTRDYCVQKRWIHIAEFPDDRGRVRREVRWHLPGHPLDGLPVGRDAGTGSLLGTVWKVVLEAKLATEAENPNALPQAQVQALDSHMSSARMDGRYDYHDGGEDLEGDGEYSAGDEDSVLHYMVGVEEPEDPFEDLQEGSVLKVCTAGVTAEERYLQNQRAAQEAAVHHIAQSLTSRDFEEFSVLAAARTEGTPARTGPYTRGKTAAGAKDAPVAGAGGRQGSGLFPPTVPKALAQATQSAEPLQRPRPVGRPATAAPTVPRPVAASQTVSQMAQPEKKEEKLPLRLRRQDCQVTRDNDWRTVCRRIMTTSALSKGEISVWELMAISPFLMKYMEEGLKVYRPVKAGTSEESMQVESLETSWLSEPELEGVMIEACRVNTQDRELFVAEAIGLNEPIPQTHPNLEPGELWGTDWAPLPLTVRTVLLKAELNGVECRAIVDDGAQVNMVSSKFFDRLNQKQPLAIRVDIKYFVSGVHGEARRLAGCFEADVSICGAVTRHVFWVNEAAPDDKIFLGMPFIMQNQVNFFWSGNRRIMSMNTLRGTTEMPMHPVEGPLVSIPDFSDSKSPKVLRLGALRKLEPQSAEANQRVLTANSIEVEGVAGITALAAEVTEWPGDEGTAEADLSGEDDETLTELEFEQEEMRMLQEAEGEAEDALQDALEHEEDVSA